MTKRYEAVKCAIGWHYVMDVADDLAIANFMEWEHAERFAADLNRDEACREANRAAGISDADVARMRADHEEHIRLAAECYRELNREEEAKQQAERDGALLAELQRAAMAESSRMQQECKRLMEQVVLPELLTREWLGVWKMDADGEITPVTQHKDAIPPPAMATQSQFVPQQVFRCRNCGESRYDVHFGACATCRLLPHVQPEKPQPTTDGERVRCCRRGADSIFMFNDEVWRNLRDDCGGHR